MIDAGKTQPLHGRPGTKALPLAGGRAVGGPVALEVLAACAAIALAAWLAAAVVLLIAAPDLAARDPLATAPVLGAHLLALGLLPFAVTGASLHLLPVMLRNDIRHPRRLRYALLLLAGGFVVAPAISFDKPLLLWPGATLLAVGVLLIVIEVFGLVVRAPRDRALVASRTGVALSCLHLVAAFALGAVVFSNGDRPVAGVIHARWLLIHLHLAVFGWLTLLIVTVGRTLAPMLAQAPTARARKLPGNEIALTAGLWTLLIGLAITSRSVALVGAAVVLGALGSFAVSIVRVARTRRIELEAPLVHMLAGVACLLQAAALGVLILTHTISSHTALPAYAVLLLVGWAGGVVLGHIGKLLSLSLWVWWPPGPRPKQASLYPRRLWLTEATVFSLGVEALALGSLTGNLALTRGAGATLTVAAVLACAGGASTWRRRWERTEAH